MVKTKSENVLGKMILSRIDKIKALTKEAGSLNRSNKRYKSTTARIMEDIYEIRDELEIIEDDYIRKTNAKEYEDLDYLALEISRAGDWGDDCFFERIQKVNYKKYISIIRKRLKKQV